eukprot:TRINITY_DN18840_c0_g1_i1.p1 TRINITY_DN18840_c0_g1~~TRINITY_DN18840_c0_g1_i1.p1  ORF type:complete len:1046 (+),score=314.47 TRINITY_DN18840_c0_g1_i1:67-3204(+)
MLSEDVELDPVPSGGSPPTCTDDALPLSPTRTARQYVKLRSKGQQEHALIRLEMLSGPSTRLLFRVIYAAVAACAAISVFDYWCMWDCTNICEGVDCGASSACMLPHENGTASWVREIGGLSRLNRFMHLTLAMNNPSYSNDTTAGTALWHLAVRQEVRYHDGTTERSEQQVVLGCAGHRQCSTGPLPAAVFAGSAGAKQLQVSLVRVPVELIGQLDTAVLVLEFQARVYTMIELAVRYTLIVAAVWRFLWTLVWLCVIPPERRLTEQLYLPLLLAFLILYLDPCSAPATAYPSVARSIPVRFVEFHCNTYCTLFMQGLFVVLMRCSAHEAHNAGLLESVVFAVWFFAMVAVDAVVALRTSTARSDYSTTFFWWAFNHSMHDTDIVSVALFFVGASLQLAWLVAAVYYARAARSWLRDQPWFQTRHRQLSFRYLLLLAVAFLVYRTSSFAISWASKGGFSVLYRSSQELGAVAITFVFVYTLVHIYSPHQPSKHAPPAPGDTRPTGELRWKTEVWLPEWYSWLAKHGGGLYYFATEQEQAVFDRIQEGGKTHYLLRCERNVEVHAQPAARARVIGFLADGAEVAVTGCHRGWLHLSTGGWAHRRDGRWHVVREGVGDTQESVTWLPWQSGRSARRGAARPFFCLETCADLLELSTRVYFQPGPDEGPLACPAVPHPCGDIAVRLAAALHPPAVVAVAGAVAAALLTPQEAAPPTPGGVEAEPAQVAAYGHRLFDHFDFANTRVFIVLLHGDPSRICVAFRGTDNSANLAADLQAARVTWAEMGGARGCASCLCPCGESPLVHRGFHDLWEVPGGVPTGQRRARQRPTTGQQSVWYRRTSLRDCTLHAVDVALQRLAGQRGSTPPRFYATGHSLGGALACLFAYTLKQRRGLDAIVYSFGAPVLGNAAFRAEYDEAVPGTFRVVNERDLVVHSAVTCANEHVGKEVCINRRGRLLVEPSWVEKTFQPTKGGARVQSHSLASHSHSLNQILEAAGLARRCRSDMSTGFEVFFAGLRRSVRARFSAPPTPSTPPPPSPPLQPMTFELV